jgi:hypothetical protein
MLYKRIIKNFSSVTFILSITITALFLVGCSNTNTGTNSNANRTAIANTNTSSATANSNSASASSAALETREPDSYSVTTKITVQPTGETPQTNIPPLQFSFAKIGSDNRRISFDLPSPVGEIVYIEKGAFKYLIVPSRNQYVELDPNELGFQLGTVLSPASVIERLKQKTQYETMGTETINGRVATKYRFKGAADTRTQAGTVEADSIVYVDQQTGLPLRSEVDAMLSTGKGARVVTETSSIQLQPEGSLFEVPTQMKKVTTAELKQQVQGFVNAMRVFAAYVRQQTGASPPPAN